jgi:hypothetical protein
MRRSLPICSAGLVVLKSLGRARSGSVAARVGSAIRAPAVQVRVHASANLATGASVSLRRHHHHHRILRSIHDQPRMADNGWRPRPVTARAVALPNFSEQGRRRVLARAISRVIGHR